MRLPTSNGVGFKKKGMPLYVAITPDQRHEMIAARELLQPIAT